MVNIYEYRAAECRRGGADLPERARRGKRKRKMRIRRRKRKRRSLRGPRQQRSSLRAHLGASNIDYRATNIFVSLDVEVARGPLTPSFFRQVAAAGGRATVACRVEGSPVAEGRLYKDGEAILPHAHGHIMLQGRDTLVLTGVGERDAGVYQCVAANSVGEAQAASHLTIRGRY